MEKALEALYVAAKAIKKMDGVESVSVENDNDSGEVYFVVDGIGYIMKLKEFDAEKD